jgi:pyruvate dehydrogenase phosphatase
LRGFWFDLRAEASSGPQGVTEDAIREAFLATEEGFLALVSRLWETQPDIATVGSCCLVGVVHNRTLFVANLGDSRAVLGKKVGRTGQITAEQLSSEHNANQEAVRNELMAQHPDDPQIVALKHGVWRVKGIIQVGLTLIPGFVLLKLETCMCSAYVGCVWCRCQDQWAICT